MDRRELLNDEQEALRMAMDGRLSSLWTAIPGIVKSIDVSKMTLEVQPAIQGQVQKADGSKEFVNLPLLVDVPVCFPSGGGFFITLPIKAGDEVLVIFASRCIDSWWQSGNVGVPLEMRMHDLSDGFAIPGPKSVPNVPGAISGDNIEIRNADRSTCLTVTDGQIIMKAPAVVVQGDLSVTGEVLTGPAQIPFTTHKHSTSTNPSGVPVP